MKPTETILCVRSSAPGLTSKMNFLNASDVWFGPREALEKTEEFRQVIPYIILRHSGCYLSYRRSKTVGDARLRGLMAIGFGGHVSMQDVVHEEETIDLWKTVGIAARREVREETGISTILDIQPVGLLVDNSTPVSRCHVGVAVVWDVEERLVLSSEIEDVKMRSLDQLKQEKDSLESWSRMCLDYL